MFFICIQALCIPLTTDKWRTRWRGMCLLSDEAGEGSSDKSEFEKQAEEWRAKPVFARDEVTITRLGMSLSSCTPGGTDMNGFVAFNRRGRTRSNSRIRVARIGCPRRVGETRRGNCTSFPSCCPAISAVFLSSCAMCTHLSTPLRPRPYCWREHLS